MGSASDSHVARLVQEGSIIHKLYGLSTASASVVARALHLLLGVITVINQKIAAGAGAAAS